MTHFLHRVSFTRPVSSLEHSDHLIDETSRKGLGLCIYVNEGADFLCVLIPLSLDLFLFLYLANRPLILWFGRGPVLTKGSQRTMTFPSCRLASSRDLRSICYIYCQITIYRKPVHRESSIPKELGSKFILGSSFLFSVEPLTS